MDSGKNTLFERPSLKKVIHKHPRASVFFQKKSEEELHPLDFVLRLSKWQKYNLHIILQTFNTGKFPKFSQFPDFFTHRKIMKIMKNTKINEIHGFSMKSIDFQWNPLIFMIFHLQFWHFVTFQKLTFRNLRLPALPMTRTRVSLSISDSHGPIGARWGGFGGI